GFPVCSYRVTCETPLLHPNISWAGGICLSVLRDHWEPSTTLSAVTLGLQALLQQPNFGDPLNHDVADYATAKGEPAGMALMTQALQGGDFLGHEVAPNPGCGPNP
ncbi:hypothetical protein KIPB_010002, partial [Kipferlia bialata]